MSKQALALTDAQLDVLRTTAAPLPRSLRSRYLQRIGEALGTPPETQLARSRCERDETL